MKERRLLAFDLIKQTQQCKAMTQLCVLALSLYFNGYMRGGEVLTDDIDSRVIADDIKNVLSKITEKTFEDISGKEALNEVRLRERSYLLAVKSYQKHAKGFTAAGRLRVKEIFYTKEAFKNFAMPLFNASSILLSHLSLINLNSLSDEESAALFLAERSYEYWERKEKQ